jgi:Tol biopolymer transport system component
MRSPRISPDGSKISIIVDEFETNWDVAILDLERNTKTRFTFDPANEFTPLWTADSQRVLFRSVRPDGIIHSKKVGSLGNSEVFWTDPSYGTLAAISPDGRYMVLIENNNGNGDLYLADLESNEEPKPLLVSSSDESSAEISPDGNYIAYSNDKSGQHEVYVRPFPGVESGLTQVSRNGGNEPKWSPDGKTLYFRNRASGHISSTTVSLSPTISFAEPNVVSRKPYGLIGWPSYAVSPIDGRFFLLKEQSLSSVDGEPPSSEFSLAFVENWFEELKRIKPTESE